MKTANNQASRQFEGTGNVLFLQGTLSTARAPLKGLTKKECLVNIIQSMISNGLLRDGDALPGERDIGDIFGVSRQTVRGALALLHEKDFLKITQGAKTRVTFNKLPSLENLNGEVYPSHQSVDEYSVVDVFEAREVLETSMVCMAALRSDPKQLERMEALLKQQCELFANPVHFQLSDYRFHMLIGESAGNPILHEYFSRLYNYRLEIRRQVMQDPQAIEKSYHEHQEIFNAIKGGDADAAKRSMCRHLSSVYKSTVNAMSQPNLR